MFPIPEQCKHEHHAPRIGVEALQSLRDCMTASAFTTSAPIRAAVLALNLACTGAVGLRHLLQTYALTDDECESAGLPLDSLEVSTYDFPLAGAQWRRVDAWDAGDCFHL